MMIGVGCLQFFVVFECVFVVRQFGGYIWVDGGIWYLCDVVLVLVVGVLNVMIGLWFVGIYEFFGDLMCDCDDQLYKESYGMVFKWVVVVWIGVDNLFD